jgi:hypothetical protein
VSHGPWEVGARSGGTSQGLRGPHLPAPLERNGPCRAQCCGCDSLFSFLPAQGADGIRGLKGTKGEKVSSHPPSSRGPASAGHSASAEPAEEGVTSGQKEWMLLCGKHVCLQTRSQVLRRAGPRVPWGVPWQGQCLCPRRLRSRCSTQPSLACRRTLSPTLLPVGSSQGAAGVSISC